MKAEMLLTNQCNSIISVWLPEFWFTVVAFVVVVVIVVVVVVVVVVVEVVLGFASEVENIF